VDQTGQAFAQVAGSTTKVKELVAEIAGATNEQAQGVDQINRAVGEMNQITQQVAANAEESASASEELNAQAAQMRAFVGELVVLVNGGDASGRAKLRPGLPPSPEPRILEQKSPEPLPRLIGANPREIIPLEEDDHHKF
jgi:methyl-accepting chemotaxis protein